MVLRFTTGDAMLVLWGGVLSGLLFGAALASRRGRWLTFALGLTAWVGTLLFIALYNPIAGGG